MPAKRQCFMPSFRRYSFHLDRGKDWVSVHHFWSLFSWLSNFEVTCSASWIETGCEIRVYLYWISNWDRSACLIVKSYHYLYRIYKYEGLTHMKGISEVYYTLHFSCCITNSYSNLYYVATALYWALGARGYWISWIIPYGAVSNSCLPHS